MLFYRLLISFIAPILAFALFVRVLRKQEQLSDFFERLGLWRELPSGPVIWLHGASNGELSAAKPVIDGILSHRPDVTLLITCNSLTAKAMLTGWNLERVEVRLAPLDLRWVYKRIVSRLLLDRFVLIEADFWPNRLIAAQSSGATTSLIGGRMSEKSHRGWTKFSGLAVRVFGAFDVISAQDEVSQERLRTLGANRAAFAPALNLKSLFQGDMPATQGDKQGAIWLAASTHDGEDEALLRAHLKARQTVSNLRMILAPRHPKRAKAVVQIAQNLNLSTALRSEGAVPDTPCDIFVADTLGEMALWYQSASICFVAGSLVPKGGHTPYEPAFYNCAILHGPYFENFQSAYAELHGQKGAYICATPEEITNALVALQNHELNATKCENARRALSTATELDAVLHALLHVKKT